MYSVHELEVPTNALSMATGVGSGLECSSRRQGSAAAPFAVCHPRASQHIHVRSCNTATAASAHAVLGRLLIRLRNSMHREPGNASHAAFPTSCRRKVHIRWHELDHRLRGVDGLDDVLTIDLNFLCRQMQPPVERQYRCDAPGASSMWINTFQRKLIPAALRRPQYHGVDWQMPALSSHMLWPHGRVVSYRASLCMLTTCMHQACGWHAGFGHALTAASVSTRSRCPACTTSTWSCSCRART